MGGLSLSAAELITLELEKFQIMKRQMEKVVSDRDSLRKEVEQLRLEKIESDKAAQFYKTWVCELEQRMLNLKADAALPNSAGTPLIPSSNKRTATGERKTDDSETKEAASHTYDSAIESDKYKQAKKITVLGATNRITPIINNIKNNRTIEQSCFGHLLDIEDAKFQGKLVLQLLLHMDMSASNKECLVFNINNSRVEFGAREFCLFTGLRLCTMEEAATITTSSSSIHEKVFMGNDTILLKDIEDRVGKGRDEMTLKMALLYFLYGTLLAGNNSKQIDLKYLDLIEDLKRFNAFPWGRVAYELLSSSMLSARSCIDDAASNIPHKKPICIFIDGFSFALQVWAYEVMPAVANYCAVRANSEEQIARILRWSTLKRKVWFTELEKFFTLGLVLDGIQASPWELEAIKDGSIPPQPEIETSLIVKDQILSDAATPTSSVNASKTHLRACVSTQTNTHHEVQADMETQPLVERCSSSAAVDVVIISDNDSDDDESAAASNSQSMKKLLAKLKRETSKQQMIIDSGLVLLTL